ncbi:glycine betaine ABC transporter substrate-binding protein [Paenibacillus qinlingensis]|uniref:ABC transporter substrate-binding protein n=1 Tax=Paenibacillus qinlingensis TaxID=1837343 RepID=UPI00156621D6|nr:glycine betaine ABC transporter substrate-binding protein [Paenibacillus qinlingensis]NQX59688.1 glycine/betaine ABC transporter substrate-binding protein [Paenibacillus qinlingensis]
MKFLEQQSGKKQGYWLHKVVTIGVAIVLTAALAGCSKSASSSSDTIKIATKGFAESDILANALKLLIENDTKLKTDVTKLDNSLLWSAVKENKVDTYVEYTGTALINILKAEAEFDPQKAYDKVKKDLKEKNQITVLDPIGFNNTYAFGLRKEQAEKFGIKTTSQLAAKSGELTFGASEEFINRPDAWPPILKTYNPKFKEIKTIQNPGLAYQAIDQKLIDSMILYTTDSQITVKPIVVLEDDKHVFLPYYAVPLVRDAVLKDHPELTTVLNKLAGKITDAEMQKLNSEVELKQRPALDVAKEWLLSKDLIKK